MCGRSPFLKMSTVIFSYMLFENLATDHQEVQSISPPLEPG